MLSEDDRSTLDVLEKVKQMSEEEKRDFIREYEEKRERESK